MVKDRFAKQLWIGFVIIAVSFFIAAAALYFFAGDLSANADAIVSARATVQNQTAAVANLANLEQQAPQAARYQAAMNQLLPDQYGIVPFAQWFGGVGKQYGVTANASFQGAMVQAQGTTPGTASFSFNAQGSPSNIVSFLNAVGAKSSGFLLTINSFDITVNGATANATGQGTLFFR